MRRGGQIEKMVGVIVTKNRHSVGAHILVCVTHKLNTWVGGTQFPEMQSRPVFENHVPAQEAFGGRALLGVNIL
jgi:hypothetical protein